MPHQIQILLPLFDNAGKPLAKVQFQAVAKELSERFGGVTAQTRAPVEGIWKTGRRSQRDILVIYEVTVGRLNRRWWRAYRKRLEKLFRQDKIAMLIYRVEQL